jgi:hypothetical protein
MRDEWRKRSDRRRGAKSYSEAAPILFPLVAVASRRIIYSSHFSRGDDEGEIDEEDPHHFVPPHVKRIVQVRRKQMGKDD